MKRFKTLATIVIAGALSWSIQAHNGVEHGGAFVEVDNLVITGGTGTLLVEGELLYDSGEFLAFEDPAGDSRAPGQGLDLTAGTIHQTSSEIVFTASITDLPLGDVQPGALYNWNLGLDHGEWTRLFAWRGTATEGSPDQWYFSVATLGDGGYSQTGVVGEFTGGAIVWRVPDATLGVAAGTYIGPGDGPITASQGGFGTLQLTGTVDYDTANWSAPDFAICGGVELELRGPNGIDYLTPRLRRDAFSAEFAELPAGTYELTLWSECGQALLEQVHTVVVH